MIRSVTVCVDYSDILELTLPYNKHFISETIIVTAEHDTRTIEVAQQHGAQCHVTDAFYRRNAAFNKFYAIEEALDVFGRHGWILLMDADIAIPQLHHPFIPQMGYIYTPHRRVMEVYKDGIPEERRWRQFKRPKANEEFSGYFQLFNAADPVLVRAPWHSVIWRIAGGNDMKFYNKWPVTKQVRPPFEVLHLGPPFVNWAGRVSPYRDGTVDPRAKERADIREAETRIKKFQGPLRRSKK